jgi:hypothetical protein
MLVHPSSVRSQRIWANVSSDVFILWSTDTAHKINQIVCELVIRLADFLAGLYFLLGSR